MVYRNSQKKVYYRYFSYKFERDDGSNLDDKAKNLNTNAFYQYGVEKAHN